MLKRLFFSIVGMVIISTVALDSAAQTAIARKRLGNTTEAMTYISSGPLAGKLAIMDGYDVILSDERSSQKLFSVLPLGVNIEPRGIAYLDAERLFAFDDPTQLSTLLLADLDGHPRGTINLTYLNGYFPEHVESLIWLPRTSPVFPNHFVMVGVTLSTTPYESRLEVIRRDGQVEAEIFPQIAFPEGEFITGLSYQSPGGFVAGLSGDGTLWRMDRNGAVLAGPVSVPDVADFEGIAQVSANRIAAAAGTTGQVMFFDANLARLPKLDRSYKVGYGLSVPTGVTWDPDTYEYLVEFLGAAAPSDQAQVVALNPFFGLVRPFLDLSSDPTARRPAYLPDEHLVAIPHSGCGGSELGCFITLYNNRGTVVEQVSEPYNVPAMTYVPGTKRFAVRRAGTPTAITLLSRSGEDTGTVIDLTATGIDAIRGLAYFNPRHPSGGEFLVLSSPTMHQAYVVDFQGNLLAQFDYKAKLGALEVQDVAFVAPGFGGNFFVLVEGGNSEILLFYLPD
jgi:hypothetical protein